MAYLLAWFFWFSAKRKQYEALVKRVEEKNKTKQKKGKGEKDRKKI
jgi:hypothetical protein